MDTWDIRQLAFRDEFLKAMEAAQQLPETDPVRQEIEKLGAHTRSVQAYSEFYRGREFWSPDLNQLHWYHLTIPRFLPIRDHIMSNQPFLREILDVGCTDGWALLNLAIANPAIRGVGIDVNAGAVKQARRNARLLNLHPQCQFYGKMIEQFTPPERYVEGFHAILAMEVLEHVLDLDAVVSRISQWLRTGGFLYITVPKSPVAGKAVLPEKLEEGAALHLRLFNDPEVLLQVLTKHMAWVPEASRVFVVTDPPGSSGTQHESLVVICQKA